MDKKFCEECGSPLNSGMMFCGGCGKQLRPTSEAATQQNSAVPPEPNAPPQPTQPQPAPSQQPQQPQQPPQPQQPQPAPPPQSSPSQPFPAQPFPVQPPRRSKKIVILIALLLTAGIVVVSSLVLLALWLFPTFLSSIPLNLDGNKQEQTERSNQLKSNQPATQLTMQISQVDNSAFPQVTVYSRIQDQSGKRVENPNKEHFLISELDGNGKAYTAQISDILPIGQSDAMNINLVLDRSGSMSDSGKIQNAKNAVGQFVNQILQNTSNYVELTTFDTYVYNTQPFTNHSASLHTAINSITLDGQTSLFDAVYDALISTNGRGGSRFVIAFTDGEENSSLHSRDDVVQLSRMTGIPVYLIGIGSNVDYSEVSALATACNGEYFNASTTDLVEVLQRIYAQVYDTQRNMCKIVYTSAYSDDLRNYRTIKLEAKGGAFEGLAQHQYMPKDAVVRMDNTKINSIISNYNSLENVAIAIVDLNTNLEYRIGSVRNTFVASGFYAPIYIVAHNNDQAAADQMMEGMDNQAGNRLISGFGGMSAINSALYNEGFTQTKFARSFGDIAASNRGLENYTSALDSAKILQKLYNIGGHTKMKWDLTRDGISVPPNSAIYAHRGQGIGGAYNAFATILSGDVKYGVAVMTMHPGKTDAQAKAIAVPMISEILKEVHNSMVNSL